MLDFSNLVQPNELRLSTACSRVCLGRATSRTHSRRLCAFAIHIWLLLRVAGGSPLVSGQGLALERLSATTDIFAVSLHHG